MIAIFRVQWRHPNWSDAAWTKSKTFHQRTAALRFATRMHAAGHEVQVDSCTRTPWTPLDDWEVES